MLGVFWNPQDKQFPKLSLDLHFEQHLKEILRFFTSAGAGGHHCIMLYFNFEREKRLTDILEMLPGTVEYRLKQMEENMRSVDLYSKLPECPVNTSI